MNVVQVLLKAEKADVGETSDLLSAARPLSLPASNGQADVLKSLVQADGGRAQGCDLRRRNARLHCGVQRPRRPAADVDQRQTLEWRLMKKTANAPTDGLREANKADATTCRRSDGWSLLVVIAAGGTNGAGICVCWTH